MTLYSIISTMFSVYIYLIIAEVLMSWIPHDASHPIFRFISDVTEPVLSPFRRLIPAVGGIDFSPLLALMAVEFVRYIVLSIIAGIFY